MKRKNKGLLSVFGNSFDEKEIEAVRKVMRSHLVGYGDLVEEFEDKFKKEIGFKYAVATTGCNTGFWLLLKALDFKPGSEIVMPNTHFYGIKNVVELFGLKIRIVDTSLPVPNLSLENLKNNITANTKAIIFLEYGGYPIVDIEAMKKYLKKINRQDVVLLLDAANSPFTKIGHKYSALDYDFAVYSFDMNKILVTGDGGIVFGNDKKVMNKVRSLSYYGLKGGIKPAYLKSKKKNRSKWWEVEVETPSLKLAMNNITAGIGLVQLEKIKGFLAKRKNLRKYYLENLKPLERSGLLSLPQQDKKWENSLYFFWIRLKSEKVRNELANFLLKNNIYSTVKYQPLDEKAHTPNSFEFYKTSLLLPFHQNISENERQDVILQIKHFFNEK